MGRPPNSKNKPKETATDERGEQIADQSTSRGEVAIFQAPRLPYHPAVEERFGVDKGQWKVLVEAIFPAAKSVDAIIMALTYCKSRNLDVFKRPVHIVPMWDSARSAMVETIWPGISELRTTASRTAGYAGCDEAEFGPVVEGEFVGRVKRDGGWKEEKVEVAYPAWCRITVYRIVAGARCKFVGPKVSWEETYASQGASNLPNKMWQERPEGQLEKCAEAAALRRAFPEEIGNELTAEEMIGRNVHDLSVDIPHVVDGAAANKDSGPPRTAPAEPPADPEQARDGMPPPREAKKAEPKADPISTGGPPRTTAPSKDTELKAEGSPKPHRISGAGHDYDSWAARYCELVKTSDDTAAVYKWIDANEQSFVDPANPGKTQKGPLARLREGKPSAYATTKKANQETIEKLRDAQERAEAKAKKKAAPPAKEMEDVAEGGDGPADGNPETILKWAKAELDAVESAEDLEGCYETIIKPRIGDLFPPDATLIDGYYREAEKRLGID